MNCIKLFAESWKRKSWFLDELLAIICTVATEVHKKKAEGFDPLTD